MSTTTAKLGMLTPEFMSIFPQVATKGTAGMDSFFSQLQFSAPGGSRLVGNIRDASPLGSRATIWIYHKNDLNKITDSSTLFIIFFSH